jgi:hypothetical protein
MEKVAMPKNFFDDLFDMRSLVSRFRSRFFGSRGEGTDTLEDEVITPSPPAQGRGLRRPGRAQAQQRPGPQRPGPSSQGPPQRPGALPQSPTPVQNQSQTPPTPAESFADQQIEIAKARGKSYLDNAFSTWMSQLYSSARNYLERIFRP